jgi:hypothetical protein
MAKEKKEIDRMKVAAEVFKAIASGESLRKACEPNGIAHSTFLGWMAEDESIADQYTRARATRADARFERVDEIMAELRSGKLDAQQARVMLDAIKWQTGKENAKRYGDALDLTSKGEKLAETKVTIERVILHGKDQKGGA